jgi:hypothetical protein
MNRSATFRAHDHGQVTEIRGEAYWRLVCGLVHPSGLTRWPSSVIS